MTKKADQSMKTIHYYRALDGVDYPSKALCRKANATRAIRDWVDASELHGNEALVVEETLIEHAAALAPLLARYVAVETAVLAAELDKIPIDASPIFDEDGEPVGASVIQDGAA